MFFFIRMLKILPVRFHSTITCKPLPTAYNITMVATPNRMELFPVYNNVFNLGISRKMLKYCLSNVKVYLLCSIPIIGHIFHDSILYFLF